MNCEPAKVVNTSWRENPRSSSALVRSAGSIAPYAAQPFGPATTPVAISAVAAASCWRASALAIAFSAPEPPASSRMLPSLSRIAGSA